jgi:hypothetical protein
MAKFDRAARVPSMSGTITTTDERIPTGERGPGWGRDAKSEVFLLAITNMVGEKTFYEGAKDRDNRFVQLIRQVAVEDPDWTARLIRWLRAEANMRSASIVAAAEYAWARRDEAGTGRTGTVHPKPTFSTRSVISSALQRADEPGEMIAYWHSVHGRNLPMPVKRGVADAVNRLYNQWSALKYDGQSHAYRMGDIIELVHVKSQIPAERLERKFEEDDAATTADVLATKGSWEVQQSDLYRWLIDRRHNRPNPRMGERLNVIKNREQLEAIPVPERRALLLSWGANASEQLNNAGMTWESLAGWLQGPMDKEAWEAMIPSMGIFALIRNLRNFDEAKVSDAVSALVTAKLNDPEVIEKSRLFPLRFLSAYKAAPSLRWSWALEQAVNHSLKNVPSLPGRTLVLVDVSGSMEESLSERSELKRWEAAALFGSALAVRAENADLWAYSSGGHNAGYYNIGPRGSVRRTRITPANGASVLPLVKQFRDCPSFGGGTETAQTVKESFDKHNRVIILTDEQAGGYYFGDPGQVLPSNVPLITCNLAGYRAAHTEAKPNRITIGGLTDQAFTMIDLYDKRAQGHWPF